MKLDMQWCHFRFRKAASNVGALNIHAKSSKQKFKLNNSMQFGFAILQFDWQRHLIFVWLKVECERYVNIAEIRSRVWVLCVVCVWNVSVSSSTFGIFTTSPTMSKITTHRNSHREKMFDADCTQHGVFSSMKMHWTLVASQWTGFFFLPLQCTVHTEIVQNFYLFFQCCYCRIQ